LWGETPDLRPRKALPRDANGDAAKVKNTPRPCCRHVRFSSEISQKDPKALEFAVAEALNEAPSRFVLGAECALQGEIDWKQVRKVVDIAHQGKH
jgi:hypothetical protein